MAPPEREKCAAARVAGVLPTTANTQAVQRQTLIVLMLSVVPAGMGMAGGFSATSLAAKDIIQNDAWATFAATMISIGGALAAVPLARHMATHGRRPGLLIGWTVAGIGSLVAFVSVLTNIFPLLAAGALAIGVGNGTNLTARYAAADLALPERRATTIGILVWASSIGSVLGPTVALGPTGWFAEQISLPQLAGPYLMGAAVFAVAGFVVHTQLRPDPLVLATSLSATTPPGSPLLTRRQDPTTQPNTQTQPNAQTQAKLFDGFRDISRRPSAVVAVVAMAVGQAVMVAIMTVTPLHMGDHNHQTQIIGLVISVHIVGMFCLAPLVGWFVDRLPNSIMVASAGVILFIGAELASQTNPDDSQGMFVGLFLIGLGWSFAMIAGSALLTGAFLAHERANVQGAADFTMVGSGAVAGLASGVIVEQSNFGSLSHWAGVAALSLVATALYSLAKTGRGRTHDNTIDSNRRVPFL